MNSHTLPQIAGLETEVFVSLAVNNHVIKAYVPDNLDERKVNSDWIINVSPLHTHIFCVDRRTLPTRQSQRAEGSRVGEKA